MYSLQVKYVEVTVLHFSCDKSVKIYKNYVKNIVKYKNILKYLIVKKLSNTKEVFRLSLGFFSCTVPTSKTQNQCLLLFEFFSAAHVWYGNENNGEQEMKSAHTFIPLCLSISYMNQKIVCG